MPTKTVADGRGARRRAETRARLTAAARELFARQGVDATRIAEITERADVGFGSFYNHFQDKDAIVEAVIADAVEEHGTKVDEATANLDDPAEVVAYAHRYFVSLAREDPTFAWLLIRLDASHRLIAGTLGPRADRDIRRGVEAGRFTIGDVALAVHLNGGALLGTIGAVLEGVVDANVDELHAAAVLRMLGLNARDAAAVARRAAPGRRAT